VSIGSILLEVRGSKKPDLGRTMSCRGEYLSKSETVCVSDTELVVYELELELV
jgi:hypothetical protein